MLTGPDFRDLLSTLERHRVRYFPFGLMMDRMKDDSISF